MWIDYSKGIRSAGCLPAWHFFGVFDTFFAGVFMLLHAAFILTYEAFILAFAAFYIALGPTYIAIIIVA